MSCPSERPSGSGSVDPGSLGRWILRPAGVSDLDRVNALIGRAVMTWALPERVKRLASPSYRYQPPDLEWLQILMAQDGPANLCGVAAWEQAAPHERPKGGRGLLLHGLYVDPDRQGQGLGTHLLTAAATAAREQGYDGLLVKAHADALGFFRARRLQEIAVEDPMRDYPSRFRMDLTDDQHP